MMLKTFGLGALLVGGVLGGAPANAHGVSEGDRVHGSGELPNGTKITISVSNRSGTPLGGPIQGHITVDDPELGRVRTTPSCLAVAGNMARVAGIADIGSGLLTVVVDVTEVDKQVGSDLVRYLRGDIIFLCRAAGGTTPIVHGHFTVRDGGGVLELGGVQP